MPFELHLEQYFPQGIQAPFDDRYVPFSHILHKILSYCRVQFEHPEHCEHKDSLVKT